MERFDQELEMAELEEGMNAITDKEIESDKAGSNQASKSSGACLPHCLKRAFCENILHGLIKPKLEIIAKGIVEMVFSETLSSRHPCNSFRQKYNRWRYKQLQ